MHLVRALKEVIDGLDLSGVEGLYDDKGGYAYEPKAMLGVLLYGLIDGERSSRRIQEHCRFDARYRFLCGAHQPDDRTICRFRRRLAPVLPDLFAQILRIARDRGMVKMQVVAVDGTRVAGNVQQWRKILSEAEDEDAADPECRTMKTRRGYINGYNAQAAADADTGIILAAQVFDDGTDYRLLPQVVDCLEVNMGEVPAAIVADKGYDSTENATMLESRGIDSYLHPRGKEAEFWDFAEDGGIVCPRGHGLVRRDTFLRRGARQLRMYVRECPKCPDRRVCHGGQYKYLSIPEGLDLAARIRNAQRCRSPEGERILRIRGPGIETVFGQLKWNKGFRRFRLRGIRAVNSEFQLECLAHNLQKVLRDLLCLLRVLRILGVGVQPAPATILSPA